MAAGSVIVTPLLAPATGLPPMSTTSEKIMGQSHPNVGQLSGLDQKIVADRLVAFLKHRYPHHTAKYVARDIKVPRHTVAKWLERGSAPNAEGLVRLIAAYRTALLIALLGGAEQWLAIAAWHERRARYEADQAVFESEMAQVFGERRP